MSEKSAAMSESKPRVRCIVVGVIDQRWAGALAHALVLGLDQAAPIRVVRVSATPPCRRAALPLPLPVVERAGATAYDLLAEVGAADLLVVECDPDTEAALRHPVLEDLRHRSRITLVEVDQDGHPVRASG